MQEFISHSLTILCYWKSGKGMSFEVRQIETELLFCHLLEVGLAFQALDSLLIKQPTILGCRKD